MRYGLTATQRDCLRVIAELTAANGFGPTCDEIARELDLKSKGRVVRLLDSLTERGFIIRRRGKARSIEILGDVALPEDVEIVGFFDDTAIAAAAWCAP